MCFKTRRAYPEEVGNRYKVLWNPQGVADFGEQPIYRIGTIESVDEEGGFCLDLDGAVMVCPAVKYGRRINPFRNLIRVD